MQMNFTRIQTELAAVATLPIATAGGFSNLWMDEGTWMKVIGPFGGLLLSLVFLYVFLRKDSQARTDRLKAEDDNKKAMIDREKREEASRERRHVEMMNLHEKNSKTIIALNTASLRREAKTAMVLQELKNEIKSRPCQRK